MMKRFVYLALAGIVGWLANTSVATAGLIAPGGTNLPAATDLPGDLTTPASVSGAVLADTGVQPFTITGGTTGFVREVVVSDSLNPLGAGKLSFVMQVSVTHGDVTKVSDAVILAAVGVDVAQGAGSLVGASTTAATSANRSLGNGVAFNFTGLAGGALLPPSVSDILIIRTDATSWTSGQIGITDGTTVNVDGFAPGPEPASVVLLGFGMAGLVGYGWKRRKAIA